MSCNQGGAELNKANRFMFLFPLLQTWTGRCVYVFVWTCEYVYMFPCVSLEFEKNRSRRE